MDSFDNYPLSRSIEIVEDSLKFPLNFLTLTVIAFKDLLFLAECVVLHQLVSRIGRGEDKGAFSFQIEVTH